MAYDIEDSLHTEFIEQDPQYQKALIWIQKIQKASAKGNNFVDSIESFILKKGYLTIRQYESLQNIVKALEDNG